MAARTPPTCIDCGMCFAGVGGWAAAVRHSFRAGHWVERDPDATLRKAKSREVG